MDQITYIFYKELLLLGPGPYYFKEVDIYKKKEKRVIYVFFSYREKLKIGWTRPQELFRGLKALLKNIKMSLGQIVDFQFLILARLPLSVRVWYFKIFQKQTAPGKLKKLPREFSDISLSSSSQSGIISPQPRPFPRSESDNSDRLIKLFSDGRGLFSFISYWKLGIATPRLESIQGIRLKPLNTYQPTPGAFNQGLPVLIFLLRKFQPLTNSQAAKNKSSIGKDHKEKGQDCRPQGIKFKSGFGHKNCKRVYYCLEG